MDRERHRFSPIQWAIERLAGQVSRLLTIQGQDQPDLLNKLFQLSGPVNHFFSSSDKVSLPYCIIGTT